MQKMIYTILQNSDNMEIGIRKAFLEQEMRMYERKSILDEYTIWQNETDKRYYTHIRVNKKRKLVSRKNREDLEEYLIKANKDAEIDAPHYKSVADVFKEWVKYKYEFDGIEKRTYDRYYQDFNRFIKNTDMAERNISTITEDELEIFVRKSIKDNNLTANGWSNLRLILRGTFQYAKKKKYATLSFTEFLDGMMLSKRVFAKRVVKDEEQVFLQEEQDMLEEHFMQKPTLTALGVILLFYTGLRVGELSALTLDDIEGNTIIVNKQEISYMNEKTKKKVYEVRDFPKTDASVRRVVIPIKALQIIELIKQKSYPNKERYLFYARDGGRVKSQRFSQKLRRACKTLNITSRSAHKIRKTYATRLINAGVPQSIIVKQMGHTDFSTTDNFYYYNDKKKDEIIKVIEGVF